MKIGDRVYVHGYVDEIRKDTVIVRNDGGYFGTVRKEIIVSKDFIMCKECKYCDRGIDEDGNPFLKCLGWVYGGTQEEDFCSHAERRTDDG